MGWSGTTRKIDYSFNSSAAANGDIVIHLSRYRDSNTIKNLTHTLSEAVTIKINNTPIDVSNIKLSLNDKLQYYEWCELVVRNASLQQGSNHVVISNITDSTVSTPNHLMLDVFSNANLTLGGN